MWLLHDSFFDVVNNNWQAPLHPNNSIFGMRRLWFKLKRVKQVLNWLNHHVYKNFFSNILQAEQLVNSVDLTCQNDHTDTNFSLLKKSKEDLFNFQAQEEVFWKQKAAAKYLVEGDNNTKCFYALVKRKRIKNIVNKIQREDGSFTDNSMEIAYLVVQHFQTCFNKVFNHAPSMDHSFIPTHISHDENANLTRPPSFEEVKETLLDINNDFVVGPNGFTTLFI
ncbi:hypothetical protein KFK09_026362 [Dendrobium nobile]|uniref:Uncharacterized protein n=1 Tax=Dendrobium nobile TaxID=94219 RepID=A0A8T3A6K7_DENNO|nr:hypothetical protein KFK09_026362 [Dendrobium nobile]